MGRGMQRTWVVRSTQSQHSVRLDAGADGRPRIVPWEAVPPPALWL